MAAKKKQRRKTSPPLRTQEASIKAGWLARPFSEAFGVVVLFLLLGFFLVTSWRKWPEPLIDFGRELYIPWRISQGAVLYRDLDGHFGPLAQYFNGLLFALFGPGLMVLVISNFVVWLGILILLYLVCRRAWGRVAAFTATAVFISVFSLSQLIIISDYNYLAPYSHETTHGMLVSLALVAALCRWVPKPTRRQSAIVGLLLGLCAVLKPEFILAGTLVTLVAVPIQLRYYSPPKILSIIAGLGAAALPTAVFTGYFASKVSAGTALADACWAWLRFTIPVRAREVVGGIQNEFAGLDKPTNHFLEHAAAVLIAFLALGVIAGIIWLLRKYRYHSLSIPICLAACVVIGWFSWSSINWVESGKCLLGLSGLYLAFYCISLFLKRRTPAELPATTARLLIVVLGVALMTRMALNGRIYQYGFFQAAIAGSIVPAILVGEFPQWLRASVRERALMLAMLCALLLPGMLKIVGSSQRYLRMKTATVGEGRDLFYTFPRQVEPTGELVAAVAASFNRADKPKSLLMVPEGILINYLTRIPSSGFYFSCAISSPQLVADFEGNPPEQVVIISRDLREYGIQRYGDKPGQGKELLDWLSEHYRQYAHAGGDPLDVRRRGAVFYRRNMTP